MKFLKYSKALQSAARFIDKERKKAINRVVVWETILIDKFLSEDSYLQKEILYYLLSNYYQDDLILLGDRHIQLIFQLILSKKVNASINLPNDVIARKNYNYLEFIREIDAISSYEIEFDKVILLPNQHIIEKIDYTDDNSNNICRLDSKEITLPLIVRSRRVGDKIAVKGLNGSKKIKDIFIDKKISMEKRDSWPIVVDS